MVKGQGATTVLCGSEARTTENVRRCTATNRCSHLVCEDLEKLADRTDSPYWRA